MGCRLQRTFFKIQDLVDHANSDPLMFLERSNAWLLWFVDMRKLAYDADALLDHVSLHLSCSDNEVTFDQEEQDVRSMVLSSLAEFQLPRKIQDMLSKLDSLAQEMEHLIKIEKFKSRGLSDYRRIHSSPSSCLVGRASNIHFISDFLSKTCNSSNFSVIAIMGMCGIGKTALARHVYNGAENFEIKLWVSVSADFDVIRITRSIIEYESLCACSLSDLESLQKMLQDKLGGKKFLLVLDDYWSEKGNDWNTLSWPFRFGSQGSKVIVTTSSTRVSSAVCCAEECTLEILSDDYCWEIIKQTATTSIESLESIGQQIAKKCKGLPLVANMLGNALRCGSSEEEWRYVLENELWDIPEDNSMFLHLMQSYVYLPAHLQNCFAYCSIFPHNYEFEMEDLILLWVAEGFVKPKGARTLEDIAKGYFKELLFRFFFQECRNSKGEVRYKMHDLLQDVARLVSGDICFHWKHDGSDQYPLFGYSCHLCLFHDSTQPLELKASVKNERLRTFIVLGGVDTILDSDLFKQLKHLKVLGLASAHLHVLVESIDALNFLRYLNISNNPIESLPSSLCKLVGLEILKLENCPNLHILPEKMSNLMKLRHLVLDTDTLTDMPPRFGELASLQYLSVYVVSTKDEAGIGELNTLNSLRGSLCIRNVNLAKVSEAREANLCSKTYLERLELRWKRMIRLLPELDGDEKMNESELLATLRPHKNLKELIIEFYAGVTYPSWLSDPSYNYTSITLQGFYYCDHLPSLGELPFLTFFSISDMPCLEVIDVGFYGAKRFPTLKSFELKEMPKLREWKSESSTGASEIVMPCISNFKLSHCPRLLIIPQKLRSLLPISDVNYCPKLQQ